MILPLVKPLEVIIVGPLPPPIQGAAIINRVLHDLCGRRAKVLTVNVTNLGTNGWKKHIVRLRSYLKAYAQIAWCRKALKIVHVEGASGLLYQFPIAVMAAVSPDSYIFYHHSSNYIYNYYSTFAVFAGLTKKSTHIFCSERMPESIDKIYKINVRPLVINNFAYVRSLHSKLPDSAPSRPVVNRKLRIGFMSTVSWSKGIGLFIDICTQLQERRTDFVALVAGEATASDVIARLESARKTLPIETLGILEGRDKEIFLNDLDILLFPSIYRFETQSLVVPEALSFAIPVMAVENGLVSEVCPEGMCLPLDTYVQAVTEMLSTFNAERQDILARRAFHFAMEARRLGERQLEQAIATLLPNISETRVMACGGG